MGRKVFTFLVGAFFFYIASPLIMPVLMGALFAVLLLPLQERMERSQGPQALVALILTLGVTLILIVPVSASLYLAAKLAFQQLQLLKTTPFAHGDWVKGILATPGVHQLTEKMGQFYPMSKREFTLTLEDLSAGVSARAADVLGGLVAHLPGTAMAVCILCVSMYFFLVDGRKLVMFFRRNSVFNPEQTNQLIHSLEATCRSVLLASIVSGAVQGIFETLVAFFTGVSSYALIGVVVFISSFIPVVGTAPVTFGLALQQYLVGNTGASITLLISAVIVALMDNLIRPLFLQGSVNLHPLLAFVAAFGGLQTLGFSGVFLGPILAGFFVVTLQIVVQARKEGN